VIPMALRVIRIKDNMNKMSMKALFFSFAGLVVIVAGYVLFTLSSQPASGVVDRMGTVSIGRLTIPVIIADTPELRTRGLSGRSALPQDSGMFFDMKSDGNHGIWMKEMHFPIDIIWIDRSLRIVTIEANAAPDSYPKVFYPRSLARYVLEVRAGFAVEHGITLGDQVAIKE